MPSCLSDWPWVRIMQKDDGMKNKPEVRVPLHRNPKVRALFFQGIVLVVFVWLVSSVLSNTITNLEARGIKTGISFLDTVAPFALPLEFSPLIEYELGKTKYWDIFFIGIQNTILISILGIISATVLGFVVGIARLAPNWLISKIAEVYVEVFRNTPLLLQIFFWNFAVFLDVFPPVRESWTLGAGFVVNKVGMVLAKPIVASPGIFAAMVVIFVGAIVTDRILRRRAKAQQETTGELPPPFRMLGLWMASLAIITYLGTMGIEWEYPEKGPFIYTGGMTFPLPGFVLWFALTVYTAAFIAENVRGGIQAVAKGQTEASSSLGFYWLRTLQLIIIPQAMRVIIPPTISQYLNLTKNSSLAVAIAYPEIVNVWAGIALNQTGQALIIIAMTIAVYETLSLITSALLNYYNSRVQLEER